MSSFSVVFVSNHLKIMETKMENGCGPRIGIPFFASLGVGLVAKSTVDRETENAGCVKWKKQIPRTILE